ncbi:MAG: hypothetical protein K0R08_849 [Solimicrobium sp.]|jgi:soluble lytic murein transglycosylase-like protein|nr:hypothetical protein [Solimicrobium sp.]
MIQKKIVTSIFSKMVVLRKNKIIITYTQQILLVFGVTATTVLALMVNEPELSNRFQTISPFFTENLVAEELRPISPAFTDSAILTNQLSRVPNAQLLPNAKLAGRTQLSVTNWLAKRYHIANDAAHLFVSAAYLTAKECKLDPLLILSVMAIESGLNPFAESPAGAQGLMQVMSKIHQKRFDELGGLEAALDPIANIRVGTQILKEYVTRTGSVEAGLKMYVGAALAEDDGGYGNKVMAEYRRLKEVSTGKPVPVFTTPRSSVVTAAAKSATIRVSQRENSMTEEQVGEQQDKLEQLAET